MGCVAWKVRVKICGVNVGQERKPYRERGFWEAPVRPAPSCFPAPGASSRVLSGMVACLGVRGSEPEDRSRAQVMLWTDCPV